MTRSAQIIAVLQDAGYRGGPIWTNAFTEQNFVRFGVTFILRIYSHGTVELFRVHSSFNAGKNTSPPEEQPHMSSVLEWLNDMLAGNPIQPSKGVKVIRGSDRT